MHSVWHLTITVLFKKQESWEEQLKGEIRMGIFTIHSLLQWQSAWPRNISLLRDQSFSRRGDSTIADVWHIQSGLRLYRRSHLPSLNIDRKTLLYKSNRDVIQQWQARRSSDVLSIICQSSYSNVTSYTNLTQHFEPYSSLIKDNLISLNVNMATTTL